MGGAPKTGDFAKMKKMDLMAAAKAMGVDTRRRGGEGTKTTWRPMPEVVDDCERALAGSSHGGSGVGVANAHAGADGGVEGATQHTHEGAKSSRLVLPWSLAAKLC